MGSNDYVKVELDHLDDFFENTEEDCRIDRIFSYFDNLSKDYNLDLSDQDGCHAKWKFLYQNIPEDNDLPCYRQIKIDVTIFTNKILQDFNFMGVRMYYVYLVYGYVDTDEIDELSNYSDQFKELKKYADDFMNKHYSDSLIVDLFNQVFCHEYIKRFGELDISISGNLYNLVRAIFLFDTDGSMLRDCYKTLKEELINCGDKYFCERRLHKVKDFIQLHDYVCSVIWMM